MMDNEDIEQQAQRENEIIAQMQALVEDYGFTQEDLEGLIAAVEV